MKIVEPSYKILTKIDGEEILKQIELAGRTAYKSEDKICKGSAERFVKSIIERNHEAVVEFGGMISVRIICDRAFSHELVRMRLSSFCQESQRYVAYDKKDEGGISFIMPVEIEKGSREYNLWLDACQATETAYNLLRLAGVKPEIARAVLPNSCKTEIVISANLRQWRHILKLRAQGTTGKPHPAMLQIMRPLCTELKSKIPVVFDDITWKE